MNETQEISTNTVRVILAASPWEGDGPRWHIREVAIQSPSGWAAVMHGRAGTEFSTSWGEADATNFTINRMADGGMRLVLQGSGEGWEAESCLVIPPDVTGFQRTHTYRFACAGMVAVHPGFQVLTTPEMRYTCMLHAHELPLAAVPSIRASVDWAVPLPCHIWHTEQWVACYGVKRLVSPGTLDTQSIPTGLALRIYYPDVGEQNVDTQGIPEIPIWTPGVPTCSHVEAGASLTLTEFFRAALRTPGTNPVLVAESLAAEVLLDSPSTPVDLATAADAIADYYSSCELWEPNALGEGLGWFRNMWVYTQSGTPAKFGYYDLGWGEGTAVEAMMGITRHWRRTGRTDLLPYVDTMTRGLHYFQREPGEEQPYFDRTDGARYGDFLVDHVPGGRIWTHSLGHMGSQILQLYQENPDYPCRETREEWLRVARSIGSFFAMRQRPNGDVQDIFLDDNQEGNLKEHRITARGVVCGLWARLAQVIDERDYIDRALRLAEAIGPDIDAYAFYNQMIDTILIPTQEIIDAEAAYYLLEGLVPLYALTRNARVLAWCRIAAAFGIGWTYFYDLPHAHQGIARGGQCCRMPDYPLLYPIGPAKGVAPLLELAQLTDDAFLHRMAGEMATFLAHYRLVVPGKPWDGGILHAIGQYCGKHWGPDLAGQVDSGMATGNSLAALEYWLAHSEQACMQSFPAIGE